MKKSILNIGRTLNKADQKSINGGWDIFPECQYRGQPCNGGRCEWNGEGELYCDLIYTL
jgi:hypothetical protein